MAEIIFPSFFFEIKLKVNSTVAEIFHPVNTDIFERKNRFRIIRPERLKNFYGGKRAAQHHQGRLLFQCK